MERTLSCNSEEIKQWINVTNNVSVHIYFGQLRHRKPCKLLTHKVTNYPVVTTIDLVAKHSQLNICRDIAAHVDSHCHLLTTPFENRLMYFNDKLLKYGTLYLHKRQLYCVFPVNNENIKDNTKFALIKKFKIRNDNNFEIKLKQYISRWSKLAIAGLTTSALTTGFITAVLANKINGKTAKNMGSDKEIEQTQDTRKQGEDRKKEEEEHRLKEYEEQQRRQAEEEHRLKEYEHQRRQEEEEEQQKEYEEQQRRQAEEEHRHKEYEEESERLEEEAKRRRQEEIFREEEQERKEEEERKREEEEERKRKEEEEQERKEEEERKKEEEEERKREEEEEQKREEEEEQKRKEEEERKREEEEERKRKEEEERKRKEEEERKRKEEEEQKRKEEEEQKRKEEEERKRKEEEEQKKKEEDEQKRKEEDDRRKQLNVEYDNFIEQGLKKTHLNKGYEIQSDRKVDITSLYNRIITSNTNKDQVKIQRFGFYQMVKNTIDTQDFIFNNKGSPKNNSEITNCQKQFRKDTNAVRWKARGLVCDHILPIYTYMNMLLIFKMNQSIDKNHVKKMKSDIGAVLNRMKDVTAILLKIDQKYYLPKVFMFWKYLAKLNIEGVPHIINDVLLNKMPAGTEDVLNNAWSTEIDDLKLTENQIGWYSTLVYIKKDNKWDFYANYETKDVINRLHQNYQNVANTVNDHYNQNSSFLTSEHK